MKRLFLFLILISIVMPLFSADCTLTFDRALEDNYSPTETITSAQICSANDEKSDAYTITWTNSTGDIVETDIGITPASKNEYFYQTYVIPSGYNGNITATMTGGDTEGTDTGNVTGADSNALIISDVTIGGKWLGLVSSIKGTLKDENDKKISGATCMVEVYSNDETIVQKLIDVTSSMGEVHANWIMDYTEFAEGTDYKAEIHCFCGDDGSGKECIDEEGAEVIKSSGEGSQPFTTNSWVSVNEVPFQITYSNGTDYPTTTSTLFAGFDDVYFRANVTTNYLTGSLIIVADTYMVDNETSESVNVGTSHTYTAENQKNLTYNVKYSVPQDLSTGQYYITSIFNVYSNNIHVSRGIINSEVFNVTSIQDTMTINSITIKDYWGNEVNTSAVALSDSSMPTSNWTNPYTVLTEGFGYQICGNITNAYSEPIYWHMENLIIHNPTTGWSVEEFHKTNVDRWQRVLPSGDTNICWYSNIPLTIPTHSDYHFDFDIHIGDEHDAFDCGDKCAFGGETQLFYVGAIEDSIVFDKWYTKPSAVADGVPLTFIVTEREEYLTMNDDCNYTNQEDTDWGNASFMCTPKDGGAKIHQNLSVYPRAGEQFKVCFQTQNWLTDEIDLEFYDIYLDSDAGETVIDFNGDYTNGYVPSIQDDKLWESETPSRAGELGGNLIDGYGIMCSHWMTLPSDVQGENNWDIQGKVRINSDIYNLEEEVIWNWESDEFPIFGTRADEDFMRLVDITDVRTDKYGGSATACTDIVVNFTYDYYGYDSIDYIAEYCFEQTDTDSVEVCYDRDINPDVGEGKVITDTFKLPYFSSSGNAEVYIHIHAIGGDDFHEHAIGSSHPEGGSHGTLLGYGDAEPYNTFSIVTDTSDSCKYSQNYDQEIEYRDALATEDSASYLGGINSSAGTFDFSITVPNTNTYNVQISGNGLTGDGRTLNRDVNVKCQVDDYAPSYKEFKIFVTDTFAFTELINVPPTDGTYTMRCTVIDSFFGENAVQAVANFNVGGGGLAGGGAGGGEEEEPKFFSIANIKDVFITEEGKLNYVVLISILIFLIVLFLIIIKLRRLEK